MKQPQRAAIIACSSFPDNTERLGALCDFLGISWVVFSDVEAFLQRQGGAGIVSVLGPLSAANEMTEGLDLESCFFYRDQASTLEGLVGSSKDGAASLNAFSRASVRVHVSKDWADLTGPLHGLELKAQVQPGDAFVPNNTCGAIAPIIETEDGPSFFACDFRGTEAFVSASGNIPDLTAPVRGKGYDVREQFLSVAPLLMYLKWAFRDSCWQANEAGACWIVDDPLLHLRYGFCDFPLLDAQMKEHTFATSVAMIPWNWRRTAPAMASLVKGSGGRLSVSVHGCDHTAQEFGSESDEGLHARTSAARRRMAQHEKATGVKHDALMIFPQGVFSRTSLRVLQQHDFVAAVNTEMLPYPRNGCAVKVADAWSTALLRYNSFPLFTRRYPSDGRENFAFDLLLGKPCLVVEHHAYFKDRHAAVVGFVQSLNALNAELQWRSLGDVIRRSFLWRRRADGTYEARMFANQLFLKNPDTQERSYRIEKADSGSAGVTEVTANGGALKWQTDGYTISFTCKVPSGAEVLLEVRYKPAPKGSEEKPPLKAAMKVAARRYLSEFRDNFLSRHDRLLAVANKVKHLTGNAK